MQVLGVTKWNTSIKVSDTIFPHTKHFKVKKEILKNKKKKNLSEWLCFPIKSYFKHFSGIGVHY